MQEKESVIVISVTQEDCSALLGEPGDAKQLPS